MTKTLLDKNFLDVERSFSGKRWLERQVNDRQALAISQQFQIPDIIGRFLSAIYIDLESFSLSNGDFLPFFFTTINSLN